MQQSFGFLHNAITGRRVRGTTLAMLASAAVLAACNSDSDTNTAPPVATVITANSGSSGQTGVVGQALSAPISVHVTDQNGALVSGAVVTWTVQAGSGSVASQTSTTDATGDATVAWTLGNAAQLDTLTASLASGGSVMITATGTAGAFTSLTLVSGNTQTITAGTTSAALVVKAVDQFGNAIPNTTVSWSVSGGGSLSSSSTTTDATGMTSVTLATDPAAAAYTVTATSGSATPVTFAITSM
jgi:adhesin/invasin